MVHRERSRAGISTIKTETQPRINSIVFTFSSGKSHWGHAVTSVMFLGALKNFPRARELCKNKKIFLANILLASRSRRRVRSWLQLLIQNRYATEARKIFKARGFIAFKSGALHQPKLKKCSYNVATTRKTWRKRFTPTRFMNIHAVPFFSVNWIAHFHWAAQMTIKDDFMK